MWLLLNLKKSYCPIDCLKRSCLPILKSKKLSRMLGLPNIACFNIYFKMSTDFVSVVLYIQVQVTDSSVTSIRGRSLGLDMPSVDVIPEIARVLHLTQGCYRGKKVHKALLFQGIEGIDEHIDNSTSITSLESVTYFDASSGLRSPEDLSWLSYVCPNLQRLNLCGNS